MGETRHLCVFSFSFLFIFVHGPMDLTRNDFLIQLPFVFFFSFEKIMGRRKNCDWSEIVIFVWRWFLVSRSMRSSFILFCFRFRAMRWRRNKFRRAIWVRPPLLPITPRRPMRQPGLTEPLQLPNLQQWPPTLPSPRSEFPPQMISTFDSFILQHLFFKTKFSYGADPYLGHSIGPVPTYGISNSAELQSVNKLVRQNKKNRIENCSI